MIELNIFASGPLNLPANPRTNTFGGVLAILYTAVNQSERAYQEEPLEEQKARASQLAEFLYRDEDVPPTDDISKFHRPTPLEKVKGHILTLTARGRRAQLSTASWGSTLARLFSPAKAVERQLLDIRLIQECVERDIFTKSVADRLVRAAVEYAMILGRLNLSMAQRALTVLYLRATQCGDVPFDARSFQLKEDQIPSLLASYNLPLSAIKNGDTIVPPHWDLIKRGFQGDLAAHMLMMLTDGGEDSRDQLAGLTTLHLDLLCGAGFLGFDLHKQIRPMIEALHAA